MTYAENVFSDVAHNGESQSHTRRTAKAWRWLAVAGLILGVALAAWLLPPMLTADAAQTSTQTQAQASLPAAGTLPAQSSADVVAPDLAAPVETASAGADVASQPATVEIATTTTSAGIVAVVGTGGVDLWSEAGGAVPAALSNGAILRASGRTEDGAWLYVTAADASGTAGWVQSASVIAFNVSSLPVMAWDAPANVGDTGVAQPAGEAAQPSDDLAPLATTEDAAGQAVALVTTTEARLNIRSGPGAGYAILARAEPDALLSVLGRSEAGDWVQVQLAAEEGGLGWVSAEYVQVSSPLVDLPIVAMPATDPTATDPPAAEPLAPSASLTALSQGDLIQGASDAALDANLSGTLVIQQSNGGMIYAYDLASGALWPVTYGFDPAISPDGATVAFTRDSAENGIYLIDIDGQNLRLIDSGHAGLRAPSWSPDGAWLVFSRSDEYEECVRMGSSCSTGARLPDDAVLSKEYDSTLAVIDINGDNYQDLATLNSARNPDWSAAGIVYQSDAGLQLTSATPAATTQLIAYDWQKPYYQDPDWQPNGGLIVFQSREASHWEIFVANADGSGVTALTQPATTLVDELPSNVSPAWSPEGQSIIFLSNRSAGGSAGEWQIMVMDADGSNARALPIDLELEYRFGGEQMLDWGV